MDSMSSTVLTINGVGLPSAAARGIRQTLQPIDGATSLRRTVNAELIDVSDSMFRKYRSTITGDDQVPPALDGVWPGMTVTVGCAVELVVEGSGTTTSTTEPEYGRPAVAGSVRHEGGYTYYRPELTMLVVDFNVDHDEWGAQTGWTLALEEV
jgi:hypothetical protein